MHVVAQILFTTPPNLPTSPGFEAGWQTIDHVVTLSDPDHGTSTGGAEFYRSNGELSSYVLHGDHDAIRVR